MPAACASSHRYIHQITRDEGMGGATFWCLRRETSLRSPTPDLLAYQIAQREAGIHDGGSYILCGMVWILLLFLLCPSVLLLQCDILTFLKRFLELIKVWTKKHFSSHWRFFFYLSIPNVYGQVIKMTMEINLYSSKWLLISNFSLLNLFSPSFYPLWFSSRFSHYSLQCCPGC